MKVEDRIRKRRRDAELKHALPEVDARLDDLRSTLGRAMSSYEAALDSAMAAVEPWADLAEDVEPIFCVELGEGPVRIGPRAAAVAAADTEAFIRDWLDPEFSNLPANIDDAVGRSFQEDLRSLDARLDDVESSVRGATLDADDMLGARLDALLAALDDAREEAEATLRKRVASGDVEPGDEQRVREARLWEEQRAAAAALRVAWEPLEQLAFAGAEETVGACGELRDILDGAVAALLEAVPELRPFAGARGKKKGARIWRIERPATNPPSGRAPGSPSFDVDDAHRITEPIDPTRTEEYPRDFAPVYDTDPPRHATPTPAPSRAPAPVPAQREVPFAFDEAVSRRVQRWEQVARGEVFLLGAPPLLYFGFLAVTAAMFRFGAASQNPFDRWTWALPVFVGLAAYCVVMPAFMGWRVRWDGLRPRIVRYEEHEERSVLQVDPEGLAVSATRIEFEGAISQIWRVQAERTWLLTYRIGRVFIAIEATAQGGAWDEATAPLTEPVPDAWQVSERTLLSLARRHAALN